MKQYMTPEMLFRDLPVEMIKLFKYCKNLEFEQKPNYKYLRSLFISILTNIGEKNDLHFCWIINIVLSKSKNQLINNISKEKEKRKDIKRINNSKVNQNKINNIYNKFLYL
jgi:predicted transcriptional regulator